MTLAAILSEQDAPSVGWPQGLPDHLSASQVNTFRRCREQYRQTQVLKKRARPGAALIWGASDHEAHEHNFLQKIDTHEDVALNEVTELFAFAFDQKVEHFGGTSEVEWGDDQPADLKDSGVRLVTAYHTHVSPLVQPVSVERKFRLQIADMPIPVVGRIDLETDTTIIERKTGGRRESQPKPDWALQGRVYQLAERKPLEWHLSVKTKTPSVATPKDTPGLRMAVSPERDRITELIFQRTATEIAYCMTTYGPDQPWPDGLSHPWACGYCGFRPTCPWWVS